MSSSPIHDRGGKPRSERSIAPRAKTAKRHYRAAAVCAPGLESVLTAELQGLGCRPRPAGNGTVEFDATPRQLYAANVWLRTASRVMVRLGTFRSTDLGHLERRAGQLDWEPWLADGATPKFRVSATDSKLYHTKAVAQRLTRAAGGHPHTDPEREQLFIVRIDRNNVTISADSSGDPLHKRPWREAVSQAPLRTSMAAAMLMRSGWADHAAESPDFGLIDPFMGCGTIPIEAALLWLGLPPGGEREFAFAGWSSFEPGTWASVAAELAAAYDRAEMRAAAHHPIILGSDRDETYITAAQENAERAGQLVTDLVCFERRVVAHLPAASGRGMVVTNPPYGKRVGDGGDLSPLYRRFGSVMRERLPEWGAAVLTSDRTLAKAADRRLKSTARFRHGGLAVELFTRPPAP